MRSLHKVMHVLKERVHCTVTLYTCVSPRIKAAKLSYFSSCNIISYLPHSIFNRNVLGVGCFEISRLITEWEIKSSNLVVLPLFKRAFPTNTDTLPTVILAVVLYKHDVYDKMVIKDFNIISRLRQTFYFARVVARLHLIREALYATRTGKHVVYLYAFAINFKIPLRILLAVIWSQKWWRPLFPRKTRVHKIPIMECDNFGQVDTVQ